MPQESGMIVIEMSVEHGLAWLLIPPMLSSLVTQSLETLSVLTGITLEMASIIPSTLRWGFSVIIYGVYVCVLMQLSGDSFWRKKQSDFVLLSAAASPVPLQGSVLYPRKESLFPLKPGSCDWELYLPRACISAEPLWHCDQNCWRADNPAQLLDSPLHQLMCNHTES